jgi:hypothetical protein
LAIRLRQRYNLRLTSRGCVPREARFWQPQTGAVPFAERRIRSDPRYLAACRRRSILNE